MLARIKETLMKDRFENEYDHPADHSTKIPAKLPWSKLVEDGWTIVGMNHYHQGGKLHLFCSMEKKSFCIKAEGTDDALVFMDLENKASEFKELFSVLTNAKGVCTWGSIPVAITGE